MRGLILEMLGTGEIIDDSDERRSRAGMWSAAVGLTLYCALMLLVVFWPVPVDSGAQARAVVQWITRTVPELTYTRLEFLTNIVMFVPFGVGLAVLIRRPGPWVVLPLALLSAVSIELVQALLLPARTGSSRDVAANVIGATAGVVLVVAWRSVLSRLRAWRRPRVLS